MICWSCWSDKENTYRKTLNHREEQKLHPSSGCPGCWAGELDLALLSGPGGACCCPAQTQPQLGGLEEPGLCPQPSAGRRGLPPPRAEKTAQLGPWLPEPLPKALHMQSSWLRSWDRPWHSPTKPCAPERGGERKTGGPKRGAPSQSSAAVFPRGSLFSLYLCPWDPAA